MATKTANKPTSAMMSRAVTRGIEAGSTAECVGCGDRVKFQAKIRLQQVICNDYVDGRWDRVEHFHAVCYTEAGDPHGPAEGPTSMR